MNDTETAATAFLVAAFIDGEPATPTEIATALSVLARNRPWLAFGKLIFAAMVAANRARCEACESPEGGIANGTA